MPTKNRNIVIKSDHYDGDVSGPFTYVSGSDMVILHPNGKVGLTGDGGLCIKIKNATNLNSTKGNVVSVSTSSADSFQLSTNDYDAIGIVYESGVPHGQDTWVVVSGIAQVLATNSSSFGGWMRSQGSTQQGKGLVDSTPTGIGALAQDVHFNEIGHCFETVPSGSNYHVKWAIHFN